MNTADPFKSRVAGWGRRLTRGFAVAIVLVLMLGGAYTWLTLSWHYSEGDRAGILQKFSSKGWLCKTYEGELALYVVGGVAPQIWYFSVRDEKTAEAMRQAVGQKLQLHYTEHRGVPSSCFAETNYFVDGLTTVP